MVWHNAIFAVYGGLALVLSLCCVQPLLAVSPTPAQIAQFQQLSPAEQKKLAERYGVELPGAVSSGQVKTLSAPETVLPRVPEGMAEINDADSARRDTKPEQSSTVENDQRRPASPKLKAAEKAAELKASQPLQPYGYDLFAGNPTTFAPATDIPVPVDYVIGPGDTIIVQLYGKENSIQELLVSREGQIQFPEIGPVSVNGLNFGELKARIDELVSEQMIGIKASVTMGALRSIRIFVLGEAYRPGSYTVSALSTMTNALFASGGVKSIGSLRNISLKRRGEQVASLDLYDLLMRGDTRNDARLLPGDVLFIPPLKKTVSIAGEVRRPAIYEIKDEQVTADIIALAGGYLPTAYPQASRVERIDAQGHRTVHDVDLSSARGRSKRLKNGDYIHVYSVLDKLENVVVLSGHVHRPGYFKWRKGMRVSDLVGEVDDLQRHADLNVALLKHQKGPQGLYEFERVHLSAALRGASWANVQLKPRDELIVLSASEDRSIVMQPYVEVLQQQAPDRLYPNTVSIWGNVKFPGQYPLTRNMMIKDVLAVSGGILPETYRRVYCIERDAQTGARTAKLIALDDELGIKSLVSAYSEVYVLPANQMDESVKRAGDSSIATSDIATSEISASDAVSDQRTTLLAPLVSALYQQSTKQEAAPVVAIKGAVEFPGEYPYVPGLSLADAIDLAGGLAENAFGLAAEVTQQHINASDEFEVAHQPLDLKLRGEQGLGYLLQPKDQLIIKQVPNWNEVRTVALKGEVKFPGVYPITSGETLSQVIQRAGGLTKHGDPKGAVFLRQSLKEKEAQALVKFKSQIEKEVTQLENEAKALENDLAKQKAVAARLVEDLNSAEATGRLVINLPGVLAGDQHHDVLLREGDQILIPAIVQEVSIVGEVQFPTSHLYAENLSVKNYLKKSGWLTQNADKKRIYMIGRDGNVRPMNKWRFLFLSMKNKAQPGDTIVVPMEVGKVGGLAYWSAVSQILFQLATTAAALETVGAI